MSRNFIFVFILLVATFSMINAVPHQLRKRETKFVLCSMPAIEPIDVTITPDPIVSEKPATYTVSGKLSHAIIAKKTLLGVRYLDADGNVPLSDLYSLPFDKSYKAGEKFTITAKDVPTPKLSKVYDTYVNIWDEELGTIACAFTEAGGNSGEEAYPIAERTYPIAERS